MLYRNLRSKGARQPLPSQVQKSQSAIFPPPCGVYNQPWCPRLATCKDAKAAEAVTSSAQELKKEKYFSAISIYKRTPTRLSRNDLYSLPYRPFILHRLPRCLAMEKISSGPLSAVPTPPDRISLCGRLIAVVPGQFHSDWEKLLKNQERAIELGAAYAVSTVTREHILGWVHQPLRACVYLNLPPTKREMLPYPALSFAEKDGFVVTGAFVVDSHECYRLLLSNKFLALEELLDSYNEILKR
jgi:hypothetical protein